MVDNGNLSFHHMVDPLEPFKSHWRLRQHAPPGQRNKIKLHSVKKPKINTIWARPTMTTWKLL